jgi:hypothetical protein
MATEETASIHRLHQAKRPKTGAERVAAHRARKRAAATLQAATVTLPPVPPADVTPATPRRNGRHGPDFSELEKSTAELMAACQRGMDAARSIVRRGVRR